MQKATTPQGNLLLVTVILGLMIFGNIGLMLLLMSDLSAVIKYTLSIFITIAEIITWILLAIFGSWKRRR